MLKVCRLRAVGALRSDVVQTRSTKSGPGRCRRFLEILASCVGRGWRRRAGFDIADVRWRFQKNGWDGGIIDVCAGNGQRDHAGFAQGALGGTAAGHVWS